MAHCRIPCEKLEGDRVREYTGQKPGGTQRVPLESLAPLIVVMYDVPEMFHRSLCVLVVAALPAAASRPVEPPPPTPLPAVLANYPPVTAERLKNPEDCNWLSIRRTYDGWGYSPLEQITPGERQRI